ncbi:AAA family ATPase [Mycobacteroides abscessus]|uniref:AAA family ATPase n=1 Tax=Mycobacteroides abscessus TaxID=36809 RepID=UPI00092905E7|nr:AAA family ATPase [Mycobacteroides abscessus]SIC20458.1 type VII secretion AAA-ATPase EccA [Mycobacteroides abscessus subsp. abscessus]
MSEALRLFEAGLLALGYPVHDQREKPNLRDARKVLVAAVRKDRTMADAWLALAATGERRLQVHEFLYTYRANLGKTLSSYGYQPTNIRDLSDPDNPSPLIYDSGVIIRAPLKTADAVTAAYIAALSREASGPDGDRRHYDTAAEIFEGKLDRCGPLTRYQAGCLYYSTQDWVRLIDAVKPLVDNTTEIQLCAAARVLTVVAMASLGMNTSAISLATEKIGQAARTPGQILPDGQAVVDFYSAMAYRALGDEARAEELFRAVLVAVPHYPGAEDALRNRGEGLITTTPAQIASRTDRWNPASAQSFEELDEASNTVDRDAILAEADAELKDFIGLETVKDQVARLKAFVKVNAIRVRKNQPELEGGRHLVFAGPPGTGKTTIGRSVAKIYCGLGLLKTAKVKEVRREDLVGQHIGETEAKTNAVIDSALDGVLIIDEAYTLVSPKMKNDFGLVAINTLLARMENDRDRLVVIVMGYEEEMELFKSANAGLRSRFSRTIYFPNYSPAALTAIAKLRASKKNMEVTSEGLLLLESTCAVLCDRMGIDPPKADETEGTERRVIDILGNARFIRNVIEIAAEEYTHRLDIAGVDDDIDDETLTSFIEQDVRGALAEQLGKDFGMYLAA